MAGPRAAPLPRPRGQDVQHSPLPPPVFGPLPYESRLSAPPLWQEGDGHKGQGGHPCLCVPQRKRSHLSFMCNLGISSSPTPPTRFCTLADSHPCSNCLVTSFLPCSGPDKRRRALRRKSCIIVRNTEEGRDTAATLLVQAIEIQPVFLTPYKFLSIDK